jgi:hypothetical protein
LTELFSPSTGEHLSYRSEPMIVASHQAIGWAEAEPVGLDIVNNARRSFIVSSDGAMSFSTVETLRAGVWEAISENLGLQIVGESPVNAVSASAMMMGGAQPKVLTRSADTATPALTSSQMDRRINSVLKREHVAVLPPVSQSTTRLQSFWEINPQTGETRGVTDNGWGGSYILLAAPLTEYEINRRVAAVLTCLIVANVGCRSTAKLATASFRIAIIKGSVPACKAALIAIFGTSFPPGVPGCEAIMRFPQSLLSERALPALEKVVFNSCFKKFLGECGKAAAVR